MAIISCLYENGVLLVDFLQPGQTINAAKFCETLGKLRDAVQLKRQGQLSRGVVTTPLIFI